MDASWPGDRKRRRDADSHRPLALIARNVAAMSRFCGIAFGLATHVLFAFTVWHLFWFLKGSPPGDARAAPIPLGTCLGIDAPLAAAFAVPHSIFLLPSVRRRLVAAGIPAPFYGCCYCLATCAALLLTIFCWQPTTVVA